MVQVEFNGFTIWPAAQRKSVCMGQEQQRIGEILQAADILLHVPKMNEIVVEIWNPVQANASLSDAYEGFKEPFLREILTPDGLPRQEESIRCPEGLVMVVVECIRKRCPGMGSYWGFEGYAMIALLDIKEGKVWDARGCRAT